MMRIITGKARGKSLETLPGTATRPTSERVKAAIFSSLQFELEGRRVLDLFAGSGQMGLEALSRGAAGATFADASPEAIAVVKENARRCGFFDVSRFLISDYRNVIRKAAGRDEYDLVFLDPPYAMNAAGDHGIPVPCYVEENVSTKVVKLIQSYTCIVNKMVWRKEG